MSRRKPRLLIGTSGSVAALKLPELALTFHELGYDIRVVLTKNAGFFLDRSRLYNQNMYDQFTRIGGHGMLLFDSDEWHLWRTVGDPVLHIELSKWADVLLLAPASADILSKISHGLSENLLLSVIRAWDNLGEKQKSKYIAPAMNTAMWSHVLTKDHMKSLERMNWLPIDPVEKTLACGDTGMGAMASIDTIKDRVYDDSFKSAENVISVESEKEQDTFDSVEMLRQSWIDKYQSSIYVRLQRDLYNQYYNGSHIYSVYICIYCLIFLIICYSVFSGIYR